MLLLGGCKFVSLVLFINVVSLLLCVFVGFVWGFLCVLFVCFFCSFLGVDGAGCLFLFCFKLSYIYENNCYALNMYK